MVVCAPGGHLTVASEIMTDVPFDTLFVVSRSTQHQSIEESYKYVIESNRDIKIFIQIFQALKLIFKFRPNVIVSTGAGIAVPFFIIAKLLGIPTVFVESASRTKSLSLSGKIVYFFTDKFYIRNSELAKKYSRAVKIHD